MQGASKSVISQITRSTKSTCHGMSSNSIQAFLLVAYGTSLYHTMIFLIAKSIHITTCNLKSLITSFHIESVIPTSLANFSSFLSLYAIDAGFLNLTSGTTDQHIWKPFQNSFSFSFFKIKIVVLKKSMMFGNQMEIYYNQKLIILS